MKHKTWTFTAKRITHNTVTLGVSFAWYPKSKGYKLYGWGMCLNLFRFYFDVNYRKQNPNAKD